MKTTTTRKKKKKKTKNNNMNNLIVVSEMKVLFAILPSLTLRTPTAQAQKQREQHSREIVLSTSMYSRYLLYTPKEQTL